MHHEKRFLLGVNSGMAGQGGKSAGEAGALRLERERFVLTGG